MKHAASKALEKLGPLLEQIRTLPGLREQSTGVFYRGPKAVLHFHEDPASVFADAWLGSRWERTEVTSAPQQEALLRKLRAGWGGMRLTEMTRSSLKALAERWLSFWQGGDLGCFDEIHSPAFIDRSSVGRSSGRDGFRQGIADLYAAFPDFHGEADRFVVDENASTVAIRWKASGTHKRIFFGVAPTGRRIQFEGIEIIRVDRNQVVERWGEWNGMEIMQQLGFAPESAGVP